MAKLDKKTAVIVSDQDRIARFVDSDDWKVVKQALIKKIVLNDSMSSLIPNIPPEKLLTEILARAQASALVLEWLREIEGTANQVKDVHEILNVAREAEIVTYFERPEN